MKVEISDTIIGDLAKKTINDAGDIVPVRVLVHRDERIEIELVWNVFLRSWVIIKKVAKDV